MSESASDIIAGYIRLLRRPLAVPEVAAFSLSEILPKRNEGHPCTLLLSPHPDDECLTGALALRLKQEMGWQVINVAVTLGSAPTRRTGRSEELAKACSFLGFDCALPQTDGFSNVSVQTRAENAVLWQQMTLRLSEIIGHYRPQAIFMPHAQDANPTHIGTHWLGMDALAKQSADFVCTVVQTEYWHPIENPNLMIGISEQDTAKLLEAVACHAGEVARNPFDARLPGYLIDNVRRGSEQVGVMGAIAAPMDFAMLYKLGLWRNGKFIPSALKRLIKAGDSIGELLV